MESIIVPLQERVKRVEAELDGVNDQMNRLQNRRTALARYLDVARVLLDMEQQQAFGSDAAVAEPTGKRFANKSIAQAAFELLLEAGRPLHVRDIWKGITEGGIRSNATKPLESLTSRLVRDRRFVNIGHRTFKLTAWDRNEATRQ
jgi:hypothetical protein